MKIEKRKTRQVKLGNLFIGSNSPVYIQTMPKLNIQNDKILTLIKDMVDAGCDVIRFAVRDRKTAESVGRLKNKVSVPLIADIHFDYKLALICIKEGVDGIRLNPCNIYRESEIKKIIELLKKYNLPVRIGVNSGSMDKFDSIILEPWAKKLGNVKTENMVDSMVRLSLLYAKFLESMDFKDIMISIKSESVFDTIMANKKIASLCDYPLHLGVTATGLFDTAVIKSAIGIGSLLSDGIGDIIRVSLTSDPVTEIKTAKRILSSLNIRNFGPEIISCPTCARSLIDVDKLAKELDKRLKNSSKNIKIAIMGCEVNGPGEAKHADIGIAGGKNSALLFKKGKKIKKVTLDKVIDTLIEYIEDWDIDSG